MVLLLSGVHNSGRYTPPLKKVYELALNAYNYV